MNPSNSSGGRSRGYSTPQSNANAPRANASGRPLLHGGGSRESMRMPSSIRIRRLPSNLAERPLSSASDTESRDFAEPGTAGRRRSSSAPQRPTLQELDQDALARQNTAEPFMPPIVEGQATSAQQARGIQPVQSRPGDATQPFPNMSRTNTAGSGGAQAMNSAGNAARGNRGLRRLRSGALPPRQQELSADAEYDADVVSLLDLIGMFLSRSPHVALALLTHSRSRGPNIRHLDQHAKFTVRPRSWPAGQSSANLRPYKTCRNRLRSQRRRWHYAHPSPENWHARFATCFYQSARRAARCRSGY